MLNERCLTKPIFSLHLKKKKKTQKVKIKQDNETRAIKKPQTLTIFITRRRKKKERNNCVTKVVTTYDTCRGFIR